jgi:hypothetical protein
MANPVIKFWSEPPQMETGNPAPVVFCDAEDLLVAYWLHNPDFPGWNSGATFDHPGFQNKVAVLKFDGVTVFRFGYPNEEAIAGHPLHKYGLKWYGFHLVENSPLIEELAVQNKVHPRNNPASWTSLRHWIITFHDETLEVVGKQASVFSVTEHSSPEDALWHTKKVVLPEQQERADDLAFFESLGDEANEMLCSREGCSNGRIKLSVMCRRHHFEMVKKKACPF